MKSFVLIGLLFISIPSYCQILNVNAKAKETKITWQDSKIINQETTRQNVIIIINEKNLTIGSTNYPIVGIAKEINGDKFRIYYKLVSTSGGYEFSINMVTYDSVYKELSSKISETLEYSWSWE